MQTISMLLNRAKKNILLSLSQNWGVTKSGHLPFPHFDVRVLRFNFSKKAMNKVRPCATLSVLECFWGCFYWFEVWEEVLVPWGRSEEAIKGPVINYEEGEGVQNRSEDGVGQFKFYP